MTMCPAGMALEHPAADLLEEYAQHGCPTQTGKPWLRDQIEAAIEQGPHVSAREEAPMKQLQEEVCAKEEAGQVKIVLWDDIKDDVPEQLKVSLIAMILHKSRKF